MRKLVMLLVALSFLLIGCVQEQTKHKEEDINDKSEVTNESNKVDDFKVSLHVENNLDVYATITYVGEAVEKDIYHGGSIFFFTIYQQDGDFEHLGSMEQPLLSTTLIRNESHSVKFTELEAIKLKPGIYEFEAIASFSLDSEDVLGTGIEIPVSLITEVE